MNEGQQQQSSQKTVDSVWARIRRRARTGAGTGYSCQQRDRSIVRFVKFFPRVDRKLSNRVCLFVVSFSQTGAQTPHVTHQSVCLSVSVYWLARSDEPTNLRVGERTKRTAQRTRPMVSKWGYVCTMCGGYHVRRRVMQLSNRTSQ